MMYFRAKFHRDCAAKAAPACGLPSEYVDLVIDLLKDGKLSACRKFSTLILLMGFYDMQIRGPRSAVLILRPGFVIYRLFVIQ